MALFAIIAVATAALLYVSRRYEIGVDRAVHETARIAAAEALSLVGARDKDWVRIATWSYWHGDAQLVEDLRQQTIPFIYETASAPHIAALEVIGELREKAAGLPSEYQAQLALANWVGTRFDHGVDRLPEDSKICDPVALLRRAQAGGRYWCEIAARLMVYSAAAVGIPARLVTVSTDGYTWEHAVAEVWSNEYDKWFVVDTDFNLIYERNGVPLSATELVLHGAAWSAKGEIGFRRFAPSKPSIPPGNGLNLYRYVHVDMRSDWCTRLLPRGSPVGGDLATWWFAAPDFKPMLTAKHRVSSASELDWKMNRIRYRLSPAEGGGIVVGLATFSPFFDHFEVRAASGEWLQLTTDHFQASEFGDDVAVRVVTLGGWRGQKASIVWQGTS